MIAEISETRERLEVSDDNDENSLVLLAEASSSRVRLENEQYIQYEDENDFELEASPENGLERPATPEQNAERPPSPVDFTRNCVYIYGVRFTKQTSGESIVKFACPVSKKRTVRKNCDCFVEFLADTECVGTRYEINRIYNLIINFKLHGARCENNETNEQIKNHFRAGLQMVGLFNQVEEKFNRYLDPNFREVMVINARELVRGANLDRENLNLLNYSTENSIYFENI